MLVQVQPQTGLIPLQKPVGQQAEKPAERPEVAVNAASDASQPGEEKKNLGYSALTWQKILPLGAMFFCILFNYTILRDTKVRSGCVAMPAGAKLITWVRGHSYLADLHLQARAPVGDHVVVTDQLSVGQPYCVVDFVGCVQLPSAC